MRVYVVGLHVFKKWCNQYLISVDQFLPIWNSRKFTSSANPPFLTLHTDYHADFLPLRSMCFTKFRDRVHQYIFLDFFACSQKNLMCDSPNIERSNNSCLAYTCLSCRFRCSCNAGKRTQQNVIILKFQHPYIASRCLYF